MKAHDDVSRYVEEWDEEVLQHVADIDIAYTHEQQVGGCGLQRIRGLGFKKRGCAMLFAAKRDVLLERRRLRFRDSGLISFSMKILFSPTWPLLRCDV